MSMKITVEIDGRSLVAKQPHEHADHIVVASIERCPQCAHAAPFKVAGDGRHIEGHDTYRARAIALCCRAHVGTIRVRVSTIFGIEEDERVLNGRARVY